KLVQLLQRETDRFAIAIKAETKQIEAQKITLLIREDRTPNLTTRQLAHIIEAIDELYATITKVYHIQQSELVVGSLDSGSDKSLDVIGIAKAIEKLSALLLESWDRVRYKSGTLLHVNAKAALEGLSVIGEIQSLHERNAITDEEAEKLKR